MLTYAHVCSRMQVDSGAATAERALGGRMRCSARYSIYLLYWYKSTNTDAKGGALDGSRVYVLGGCDAFSHPQVYFIFLFF
jgi:hypothetical protein